MKRLLALILVLTMSFFVIVNAEDRITVYAPDGRTLVIAESELEAYLNVGWYKEPVRCLYAEDGRSHVFPEFMVEAQCTVGWYKEPVQRLYSEDGRSRVFPKSMVAAQCTVGWYKEPVQRLYAADGRSHVFPKSMVAAQCTVGWYTSPVADSGYRQAYARLLHSKVNTEKYKDAEFSLVYIDNNDIPELVVGFHSTRHAGAEIYTYRNGIIVQFSHVVGGEKRDTYGEYGGILYREREGLFVSQHWHMGVEALIIYRLSNGVATEEALLKGVLDDLLDIEPCYEINGVEVDFEVYMDKRRSYGFTGEFYTSDGYEHSLYSASDLTRKNIKSVLGI